MSEEQSQPAWRPLKKVERRILGVLIEKAKTTPDQYPLSLNALVNGCNQKSNRDPQMSLQEGQVEDTLLKLRQESAVGEVQGGGRVPKYRHYMKEWLGVSGPEMAVMAELMLRGDQTIGELRGRANRMTSNEIPDVASLRPVLESLIHKKLVVPLTPAGRGQSVTHALYQGDELASIKAKYGGDFSSAGPNAPTAAPVPTAASSTIPDAPSAEQVTRSAPTTSIQEGDTTLREEVGLLRDEVARLKKEVEDLWANLR